MERMKEEWRFHCKINIYFQTKDEKESNANEEKKEK
jgi:hypothetical protein